MSTKEEVLEAMAQAAYDAPVPMGMQGVDKRRYETAAALRAAYALGWQLVPVGAAPTLLDE